MQMDSCVSCGGFVPSGAAACPCCGVVSRPASPRARALRGALALAGGSLFAVTLSACYGGGVYPEDYYDAGSDAEAALCDDLSTDLDDDLHCGAFDCDETDADRNATAFDVPGDGVDQDCDGADTTE